MMAKIKSYTLDELIDGYQNTKKYIMMYDIH